MLKKIGVNQLIVAMTMFIIGGMAAACVLIVILSILK